MISMQDVAKAASVSELLYRRFSINILMLVTRLEKSTNDYRAPKLSAKSIGEKFEKIRD